MANMGAAPKHGEWWGVLHTVGYVFPVLLLIAGYLTPSMRTSIFSPAPYGPMFWIFVAAVGWLIMDFFVVTSQKSTATQLTTNVFISSLLDDILIFVAGGMIFLGTMEWWMVVPTVAAWVDDKIVGNRAIINALQKPFGLAGSAGH